MGDQKPAPKPSNPAPRDPQAVAPQTHQPVDLPSMEIIEFSQNGGEGGRLADYLKATNRKASE